MREIPSTELVRAPSKDPAALRPHNLPELKARTGIAAATTRCASSMNSVAVQQTHFQKAKEEDDDITISSAPWNV